MAGVVGLCFHAGMVARSATLGQGARVRVLCGGRDEGVRGDAGVAGGEGPPSSALRTGPSSALRTGPSSALRTGPSSALRTGPSSALRTGPSSALRTGPSSALRTGPSSALRTGFDRLRANGSRIARATASRGCEGGGDAPRHAPLDTGFRRYDDVGEFGVAGAGGDGWVGVPLRRDGRFANRPYDGVWGTRRCDRVGGEVAPPGARSPFDFPQGERPPQRRMALSRWVLACAGRTGVGAA